MPKKIKKSNTKNEFLKQFSDLSYDRNETVGQNEYETSNGINTSLQRAIELREGFTSVDANMNYKITDKITHNNMQEFHSMRGKDIGKSNYKTKLGIFTGNDEFWKHKKEQPNFFQPMKNLTNVNGMKVITDKLKNRYMPSMYKNGDELPNSRKLVGKGLNGKDQIGLYNTTRIMPKSTNQLRAKNNQKVSYKGEMIESGMKGERRTANLNLTKFKKKDFREQRTSDFVKPKLTQLKRTIHGKYTNKRTNRANHIEYSGPAMNNVQKIISAGDIDFTPSSKSSFNTNLLNTKSNNNKILNNKRSFRNRENERSEKQIEHTGIINTQNNKIYNNSYTPLNATLKEQTSFSHEGYLNINKNMYNNNYQNPEITLKEQTSFSHEGNLQENFNNYNNTFQNPDITLKEQTSYSHDGQMKNSYNNYNNTYEQPEITLKEQTSYQYDGNLQNKHNNYNNTYEQPEITLKEQTSFQYDGNLENKHNNYNNTFQNPDITLKEQTSFQHDGNLQNKFNAYNNTFDSPDTTLKEQLLYQQNGNIDKQNNVYNNTFSNPSMPLKEQTLYHANGSIDNKNLTYARDQDMNAKTTIRETTLAAYEGHLNNNNGTYFKNNDEARYTIKQSTLIENYSGGASNNQGNRSYDSVKNYNPLCKTGTKLNDRKNLNGGNSENSNYKNLIGYSVKDMGETQSLKAQLKNKNTAGHGHYPLNSTSKLPTFATKLENDNNELHKQGEFVNYNPDLKDSLKKNPFINNVTFHSIVY